MDGQEKRVIKIGAVDGALEEDIMASNIPDAEKTKKLSRLIKIRSKKVNIMLVGSTGSYDEWDCGKVYRRINWGRTENRTLHRTFQSYLKNLRRFK